MRFTVGWLLFAVTALVGKGVPAEGQCALDPAIREKLAFCPAGSAEELCLWLPVVESLATGDLDSAEKAMAATFGLPPALAAPVLSWVSGTIDSLSSDPACRREQNLRFLRRAAATDPLADLERQPASRLFVGITLGTGEEYLAVMEASVDPAAIPAIRRAGRSYRRLLEKLGGSSILMRRIDQDAFFEGVGPQDLGLTNLSPEEAGELRRISGILAHLARGDDEGRRLLAATDWTRSPRWATRTGYALARSGFLVDAEAFLRRGERDLAGDTSAEGRYLWVLAGWLRAWVLLELGLADESERVLEKLMALDDPVARELLQILPPPDAAGIAASSFCRLSLPHLLEVGSRVEASPADPLPGTLGTIWPRWQGFSAGPQRGPAPNELEVMMLIARRQPDEALAAAEAFIAAYPRYENIRVFFLISLVYGGQGRPAEALKVLERAVGLLEERLGSFVDDDVARSFMGRIEPFFALAVEMSSRWGGDGLFYSERSRSFALRRLLGHPPVAAGARLSAEEKVFETRLRQLERSPGRDPETFRKLYLGFEAARRRRRSGETPAESRPVAPPQVNGAVRPGEALLVFYETRGMLQALQPSIGEAAEGFWSGQLFAWLITAAGSRRLAIDLAPADWEHFDCLVRHLRDEDGAPPDSSAGGRGARILGSCAGAEAEIDPAAELHGLLIEPFRDLLRPVRRLLIVPHRGLHLLPFGTLRDAEKGRLLVEDFELAIAPSIDILGQMRRRAAGG